jgi:3-deoxy-D-manno-octulosonic-acid transferase
MPLYMAASDVVFMGGSLVPLGGHNILEAAALGLPVVFGPSMFNFETISGMLVAGGAARQIADSAALSKLVAHWLRHADERHAIGAQGQAMVDQHKGAGERVMTIVQHLLG